MSAYLAYAVRHRWLGIVWDSTLGFDAELQTRVAMASEIFALLAGVVQQRAIPLHLALIVFETKVDSIMDQNRWLYGVGDKVAVRLDKLYADWAKALLGLPTWRNDGVSQLELGWRWTGFQRAVRSVGLRRARLSLLPHDDTYRWAFLLTVVHFSMGAWRTHGGRMAYTNIKEHYIYF